MNRTAVEKRYWLIELLANWEGRVNSGHLQHYCQLGRQQASKVFPTHVGVFLAKPGCGKSLARLPHARGGVSKEVASLAWG